MLTAPRFTAAMPRPQETSRRYTSAPMDVWIEDDSLFAFWERVKPLVHRGASALEIAERLKIDLARVWPRMSELHTLGQIKPLAH